MHRHPSYNPFSVFPSPSPLINPLLLHRFSLSFHHHSTSRRVPLPTTNSIATCLHEIIKTTLPLSQLWFCIRNTTRKTSSRFTFSPFFFLPLLFEFYCLFSLQDSIMKNLQILSNSKVLSDCDLYQNSIY